VSFSEDVARLGDQLAGLVGSGVAVAEAAAVLGITRQRCYAILRARGVGLGKPKRVIGPAEESLVLQVFGDTGSVNQAAKAAGVAFSVARRILVTEGLFGAVPRSHGKPEAKRRFLELIAAGWSMKEAAAEVGVHYRTAKDWRAGIRRSGHLRIRPDGVVVNYRPGDGYKHAVINTGGAAAAPISHRYLSLQNRLDIADGLLTGQSVTAIAARIGKHKSTVSREIRAHHVEGHYLPYRANERARAARARPKVSKLAAEGLLRQAVDDGLSRRRSPEQISNRLRIDYPDDESMRVSHETIYQALYCQARGGLRRELVTALRTGRTRRTPRRAPDRRTRRFVDPMIMISDRPAEVDDRAVPGHWEGDLIVGTDSRSAIGTLVERSTRYTMLVHLPGSHDAETVRDGLIATISTLPAHLRGSLTWDQGAEMARHRQISMATDMQVYFCDPASPWQRGSNENTNGLLRQYFPKGTDLSVYGPEDLEHVAQELNDRPRKTLGWETPPPPKPLGW
jgi:IS30 family transposase/molybdenum-dependent DNA-binding transcriptional regulator ModE